MPTKRQKRKDGNYAIRRKVAPYKDKNGRVQTYRTFYGKTIKEAESKFREYKAGTNNAPAFFDDLINAWILETFLPDPRLSPRTKQRYIDAYRKNLEPQKEFIHKAITDITYQDIQRAYNNMTCAPSSVRACHKLLVRFFALMTATGTINRDPLQGVIIPAPKKKTPTGEIITFTEKELSSIKEYLHRSDLNAFEQKRIDKYRFLILLLMSTGARISEALALTYEDITPEHITINKQVSARPVFENGKSAGYDLIITDTKTPRAIRTIPITKSLYSEFIEHKKRHRAEMIRKGYRTNYVFTTSTGSLIDKRSLRHSLDRIHASAGARPLGAHAYRRTFASRLAAAGTPIQVLADLLGHTDINITAKYYINVPDTAKKSAVELLG